MIPEHYMEGDTQSGPWKGTRELIMRVYVDEPGGAVLGLNAIMDTDIYFDAQDKQIGIAPADCLHEVA